MKQFHEKITSSGDGQFKDFTGKIDQIGNLIESFFEGEIKKVEKSTNEILELLKKLILEIKRLISMYKMKFKEQFTSIKDDYKKFCIELENCKNFKKNNFK